MSPSFRLSARTLPATRTTATDLDTINRSFGLVQLLSDALSD